MAPMNYPLGDFVEQQRISGHHLCGRADVQYVERRSIIYFSLSLCGRMKAVRVSFDVLFIFYSISVKKFALQFQIRCLLPMGLAKVFLILCVSSTTGMVGI